jgi:phosphatidylinositol-bisphosphatase
VFWCGDFNYRIDLPMDDVKEGILQENFELLQVEDQLTKNKSSNKVKETTSPFSLGIFAAF